MQKGKIMIVKLIDSYLTSRQEFQLTCGYQPDHVVLYLLDGAFSCTINENEFLVKAGDIAVFDTESAMSRHVLEPIRFLYVKFQPRRDEFFTIKSGVWHNIDGRSREDLEQIDRLSSMQTQTGLRLREHYLNDLFLCLSEQPTKHEKIIASAEDFTPIAYMKKHIQKGMTMEALARACGSSVSSLESHFRSLYGTSPYRYFIRLRMEEAQRLLAKTSYTVTESAMRCGYENLFYFCNAFKKHSGMTPTEYRKMNLI